VDKEHLWFLDTLVTVHVGHAVGSDRISLLEHRARRGDSPPLHIHRNEDEAFHVIEGRVLIHQPEAQDVTLESGEALLAPKGMPHTYRVESATARWLTVTNNGDFENFVRSAGRTAGGIELPPVSPPPTEAQAAELGRLSGSFGIDLVGPPLH
jgi:quercetin dioxygenase-like cupin family protein